MSAPERFYGLPGAEQLRDDPAGVWESDIEPLLDEDNLGPWEIYEHTVQPALNFLPAADDIINYMDEHACDNGVGGDECPFEGATVGPKLLVAAEALRQAMSDACTWHWADKHVATHVLAIVDGEPHLDGEPLYRTKESS